MITLTPQQAEIIYKPLPTKIFLEGPVGTGKTTIGVERLLHYLTQGVHGNNIIVITPQRTLATAYADRLKSLVTPIGGQVAFTTLGGLAQRMVNLFWPLIAKQAGFGRPEDPPTFLTLETAQYYMAYIVRPLLKEGFFDAVLIDRNRLYSQIIDNLNKSAVIGFPHTEIGERLKNAWAGEPVQLRIYDDTQDCANRFRQFCLANNLLDFSLQVQVFTQHLWPHQFCYDYLTRNFSHLIIDNVEEDTPVAHDIYREWISKSNSALIIYDQNGGHRYFLGADPVSAYQIKDSCTEHYVLSETLVASLEIIQLDTLVSAYFHQERPAKISIDPRPAFVHASHRFYPQMLDWVAGEVASLVQDSKIPPGDIAVLAPFLSDSLRFALAYRLEQLGVLTRSHRPSRSLRDEHTTQCLLTLTAIAHPSWGIHRNKFDVAYALVQAIDGLDLIRAQLLTEIVYRTKDGQPYLSSFDIIAPEIQERITYLIGSRYETLLHWLTSYKEHPPLELDHFISLLFGEVLSQLGFGFHAHYDTASITANIIESIHKFRRVTGDHLAQAGIPLGQEYWWMVQDGVISAQYLQPWQINPEDAVLLAPAHTFLLMNRPVAVQIWLDIGNRSWSERLNQPLTHPYVLSRQWDENRIWTDTEEVEVDQNILFRLITGLLHRCQQKVYLAFSEFNEQGYEQRSPMLRTFQHILQTLAKEELS